MAYYLKDPLALNGQTACDPPEVINGELFLVFFFLETILHECRVKHVPCMAAKIISTKNSCYQIFFLFYCFQTCFVNEVVTPVFKAFIGRERRDL